MKQKGIKDVKIIKINEGVAKAVYDQVVIESPLEIRVRHRNILSQVAITMRTPGNDQDLSIGFLFTEGILIDFSKVLEIIEIDQNIIEIQLTDDTVLPDRLLQRNTFMSSSCGICGKASLDLIKTNTQFLPWATKFEIALTKILSLRTKLDEMNNLFSQTGGNHTVALFDLEAKLIHLSEDVGRHNAMDKLIGSQLRHAKVPFNNSICLLSGRASFELVQKAMMVGVGCIVAVGAPSSLAIELSQECGMTLIGFLKDDRFNIYTGNERIKM